MKKEDVTVIISRLSGVPARKFRVSRKLMIAAFLSVAVLFLSVTFSFLHYFYMWTQSKDHAKLRTEVLQLRKQNDTFRLLTKQLTDRLSSMEVSANKLRIVSGLEEDGLGGVGGPSSGNNMVLGLDETSLYNHLKSLDRRSMSLQNELQRLQDFYKERGILMAATPSLMPVHGYPSDHFGYRMDPFTGKKDFHPGIDLSAPKGNKVVATADGVVVLAGRLVGLGNAVKIQHGFGIVTRYGHMSRVVVQKGQEVRKGDVIGFVGSTGRATGSHLHYEVRLNGRPLDPARFFRDKE